jgi:uncharacterized protein with NRDE domain
MCTVVYIPQIYGCYFASLRDESPVRVKAITPQIITNKEVSFIAPIDPEGNGTWIGTNEIGNVIVLLNGGFESHKQEKPYRKSRGLIVTELLATEMPVVEWSLMDLEGIEPFTLVIWSEKSLFQLVWDGEKKHRTRLESDKSYVWSSSTLYNKEARDIREDLFQNWIAMNPPITKLSLLAFFKMFNDEKNGFIMNRNEIVKTLSYTFIELYFEKHSNISYYDFEKYTYFTSQLEIVTNRKCC